MTKLEFIFALKDELSELPPDEVDDRLVFYSEMIDDRIEEGFSEEDAVNDIGSIEEIVSQILADTPLLKIVKHKVKPKRKMKTWEIVLLAAGSPIWLSLGIAAFAVILSLYCVFWSVIASVWACFAALSGSALGGLAGGIVLICVGKLYSGLATIGAGLVCGGLAILAFIGCLKATRGCAWLSKTVVLLIKKAFIRKERA